MYRCVFSVCINTKDSVLKLQSNCLRTYWSSAVEGNFSWNFTRQASCKRCYTSGVFSYEHLASTEKEVVKKLFQGILNHERGSLSRAITLIESTHPRKQEQAQILLSRILQHHKEVEASSKEYTPSFRIGILNMTWTWHSYFSCMTNQKVTTKQVRTDNCDQFL